MKKFYKISLAFFILFFGFYISVFAQNLVPNPSFEILDTCPDAMSQIDKATGWIPFTSSPDLYHTCANFSGNITAFTYQCPATGNAFAGIFCYMPYGNEIFGIELLDSLIIGTKYYISFKVNLANNAGCGIDKLGARFSTKKYCYSLDDFTNLCDSTPAQIENIAHVYSTQIITDTNNWTKISGSFEADSNYKYIMIGHLFDTSATNFYLFPGYLNCEGYVYFIDDICVSTDSLTCVDITLDIVNFSSDSTTIQDGSCINFNINTVVDYDLYQWQFPGAIPNNSNNSNPTNICYGSSGNFDVILIVSSSSGCSDTIHKENYITVKPNSSINENKLQNIIEIYPVPTKDFLFIESKNEKNINVKIYNLLGELVYKQENLILNNNKLDLSDLYKGIYFIKLLTRKEVITKKIIKL